MGDVIHIAAELRDQAGKGVARAVRREGKVPAVIYGDNQGTLSISLDGSELNKLIKNPGFFTQIFAVDITGKKHEVLARDIQTDPVTDFPLHVDFMRFNQNTRIVIEVPVSFLNEEASPGLKRGGVLNIVRRELELRCSPTNIPQAIEIDLTGFDIGDSIHISALNLPDGVEPITDRDYTIATVAAPTVMAVEEEGEEDEITEGEEGEEGAEVTEDGTPEVTERDSEN
ncbi:MAG: 50S ribosomal protein L25/general stress protein Ctc [Pseudomonadota bacterium]|nr:50S ribosomal protein L25/general stress protein Ctc [Pseudomonadota bacterium]